MLRIALLAILAFASVRPLFGYDLTNPILDYCYHAPDPNPTLESPTGLTKILWVICATDSAAIQPYDSLPFGTGGQCGSDGQGHRFRRETYPSTYDMPSWMDVVFDSLNDHSLSRYLSDQSHGIKAVSGRVVGDTSGTIFLCDSNVYLEPNQCVGHTGGSTFFLNIMGKVDAQNDLAEFLGNPNDSDIYVFFHLYGHAETRTYLDHNGQDSTVTYVAGGGNGSLPWTYLSADTNAAGQRIGVRGCTGWSNSEQFIATQPVGQRDPQLLAYWDGISILAHEFGHDLGLNHTFENDGDGANNSDFNQVPVGSFDIMGYSPRFWDKDGAYFPGQPGPYHPASRMNVLHWIDPVVVDRPCFQLTVGDNLTTGDCLKFPAYVNPATDPYGDSDGQYFLAVLSTRESLWERWTPGNGIMIYHFNAWGNQDRRQNKKYDMEQSSGLTDWTARVEPCGPFYGNFSLPTGENLLTPNTTTGMDSFDFRIYHSYIPLGQGPDSIHPALEHLNGGEHGSPLNFFRQGQSFTPLTNPTSDAYANTNTTINPQYLATMAGLEIVSVDSVFHSSTVNAWSRHWRGTVSTSVTWLDSVVVDSSLSQSIGTTLTILPGTYVKLAAGTHLDIYGKFRAIGTEEDPIIFEFPSNTGTGGLYFMGTDTVQLEYCIIKRSPMMMVSGGAHLWISDCTFDSCVWGLNLYDAATNAAVVEDNLFTRCSYGLSGQLSAGTIRRNVFENCAKAGIFWQGDRVKGERAYITENEVRGCGFMAPSIWGGAYFTGSTAILECNLFEHNYKYQVNCANNANVVMNGDYSGRGRNELTDTVAVTWCGDCNENIPTNFRPLLHLTNSYPALDGGYNSFRLNPLGNSSDGCFIFDKSQRCSVSFSYNIEQNYYELAGVLADPPDSNNLHFCPPTAFSDVDPADEPSVCTTTLLSGLSGPQAAYAEAAAMETSGDLAGASAEYADVIEEYPGTVQAIWSTRGYLRTGLANEVPAMQRHDELLALWNADSLHEGVRRAARCEAVWALVAAAMYEDARTELEAICTDPASGDDSLWAVETAYLVDFLDTGAGTMRAESRGEQLRARLRTLHERLELLAMEDVITEEAAAASSSELPLATAHPNPFNSTVAIILNLPNAGPAKVEIFNLLGQKVTTLLDKPLSAGLTRLVWNADNHAAGVYLYHVEYAGRVETHKLLLLK